MNTVKLKSEGIDVLFLQKRLGIVADGKFGAKTEEAVKKYQKEKGLVSDGIVGNKTWATFDVPTITEQDYKDAANILGCDVAAIKAVKSVETGGKGFIDLIRPSILFEGHVFYKNITNASYYALRYPNICYKTWNKSKYKGGNGEYDRLSQAWSINSTAALKSASIGLFQIMGGNYKACGCSSVQEMWANACMGEREQLLQFCNFLKNNGISVYLKKHDWVMFAKKYNGAGYAQNKYDTKLKAAYEKYSK